jgi:hypothetical protein
MDNAIPYDQADQQARAYNSYFEECIKIEFI